MAIDLGSAAATLSLDVSSFVSNAGKAEQAMQGIQNTSNSISGDGGFLNWVNQNEASLTKWGKGMLAVGGIITGAFAAPIIAGSKAAWGQVDAVEQATIAMNAYADSTEQVDGVLADLLAYARSDMGVLFSRQELFSAAQSMLIYGASIEDVTGYTEILSRSVGLGLSNWDDLNTIIGRVGSTGRLTGNDFDMLKARGFDLDESLRNTNITWDQLFAALDKGIPADALAGQADTIRGKSIRLQSALRGLGLAFLGVDSETSKFIEGGLGWQMMRGMERLTDLMKRAAPAVGNLGSIFASIGRPIGQIFDLLMRLPQPVQTGILMFTALSGVALTAGGSFLLLLPRIAATVSALQGLGGITGILGGLTNAVGALRVAMLGLLLNPAMLAAAAFFGTLFLLYKTNFMGFADAVDVGIQKVKDLWTALQIVFGGPSSKTISIYDDWQADEYTIKSETLPDGTKLWHIVEDQTGETFGDVIQSYTDATGTTYILVEPKEGGPAFWAKADLESAKPEKIEVPVLAKDEPFQATMDTILSATGDEVTVLVNGDGEPFANVIGDIITDPTTGEKSVTIELPNGDQWVAEVDEATGSIIPERQIKIGADTSKLSEVENLAGNINDLVGDIQAAWVLFNTAIDETIGLIEDVIDLAGRMWSAIRGEGDPSKTAEDYYGEGADQYPATYGQGQAYEPPIRTKRENYSQTNMSQTDFQNLTAGGPAFGLGQAFKDIAASALDASTAIGETTAATLAASQPFQSLQSVIGTSASTATGFSGTMNTTATTTDAAGATMGSAFNAIAASASARFSEASSYAQTKFAALQASITNQSTTARGNAIGQFAALAAGAALNFATMNNNATSQASAMNASVAGQFMGMKTAAAIQTAMMASNAKSSGTQMSSGLTGWIAGASARIAAGVMAMVASVRNAGGSGYSAGYYAGSQIGAGMAAGMYAYLGQISAAANAMVNSAAAAVRARAMISSPSRLFKQYGAYIGEGMELGILGKVGDVQRASDMLVTAPSMNYPIRGGGYGAGGYGGGTTVIDNSQVHYVALTESDFQQLLAKSDRGNQAADHLAGNRNRNGFERGVR